MPVSWTWNSTDAWVGEMQRVHSRSCIAIKDVFGWWASNCGLMQTPFFSAVSEGP